MLLVRGAVNEGRSTSGLLYALQDSQLGPALSGIHPVSYTHLSTKGCDSMSPMVPPSSVMTTSAVSYTHLGAEYRIRTPCGSNYPAGNILQKLLEIAALQEIGQLKLLVAKVGKLRACLLYTSRCV